jgi:hypothetical protein
LLASVVAATAATPTGATGTEGITTAITATVTTAAITAVFPAASSRAALAAATSAATTTAGITTATAISTAAVAATTAVAAAARAAITTATAIAATTTTGAAGFGFVDAQGAAHQLGALEGVDGAGLTVLISHLHEGEAALAAGVALEGKETVADLTKGCEQLGNVLLFRAEGEVSYKNAHRPRGPIRQNFSPRRLSRL